MPRTHKHLVEAQPLHLSVPGMDLKHTIKPLTHVSERREVLPIHDDQLGTRLLSSRHLRQLGHAARTRDIVAGGENPLLPDAQREALQCGISVLEDGRIEAVIVLTSESARHNNCQYIQRHPRAFPGLPRQESKPCSSLGD